MIFWLRTALKEVAVNKGFSLFFVLNLAVGLAGFMAVQSFGRSLDRHMAENLKEILTADLVLSAASPLTEEEAAVVAEVLGPDKSEARLVAFYTMVRSMTGTEHAVREGDTAGPMKRPDARLVRVMAVDSAYPLHGNFIFEDKSSANDLQTAPWVFMTRDTALSLGLRNEADLKAPLRIGDKDFHIRDFFAEDPDKSLTAVDLAPKIYMGLDQLDGTGLVRFGSRILHLYFYAFPEGRDVPALSKQLSGRLFDLSRGNPRINMMDVRDVNRQLGRLTRYFTGYMGLVSIVALFLAGLSAAYLFRGVAAMKQREMAILMSTGAVRREIYFFVSLQLVMLGAAASVLALAGAALLMPAFPMIFKGLVPPGLVLSIDPMSVVLSIAMGTLGSLVFCLPVFASLFRAQPLELLRAGAGGASGGSGQSKGGGRRWLLLFTVLPGLVLFFIVSMLVAGRVRDGVIFALGFILAMAILSMVGLGLFQCFRLAAETRMPPRLFAVKIALRNLFRNQWAALACFVTIAMGVFLIALIPQIQNGLGAEITRPQGLKLPVFFLVDIQDEQKPLLERFMAGQPGQLSHISPVVQGRILRVNGRPFFEKPPDNGRSARGRPGRLRGQRLEFIFSFRDRLADSETLVKGSPLPEIPWEFGSPEPFGISMAVSFADRFGFKIGDTIEFDVQGISLTGQVRNLRKVRWNSFQPNFFLLFQDGVLNDAPKTHLGAISDVPKDRRRDLKNQLVDQFPNISVIDVTQTAATILGVTDRLSLSVRFMAWLAIAAGLVSIFSISRHQARKNQNQINLLKVLGCGGRSLMAVTLSEFGLIGFLASVSALGLSMAFSWGISWYFFDNLWQLDLAYLFAILVLSTSVCMATGLFAARKVMKENPLTLLNAGE